MSPRPPLPQRILIPLANPRTAADLVRIGSALLAPGGSLVCLSIVEIPEGLPLSEGATRARQSRRLLQRVYEFATPGAPINTVVRIGRRAAEGIVEVAAEEGADLIIFGWGGRIGGGPGGVVDGSVVFSSTIDEVVRESVCDIAVVKQRGIASVDRILAPVRGGPHADLALRFADALGAAFEARVDVLHVIPEGVDDTVRSQSERALRAFVQQRASEVAKPLLVEGEAVTSVILREADSAQLVVMGASAAVGPGPDTPLFGVIPEQIAQQARTSVIVVRTREQPSRMLFEERATQAETLEAADRAAEQGVSVQARVDRWFAESNYHHSEFSDLHRLVALKEKQGLTISAVLPTLNEGATIGPIVERARKALMEQVPLLDELLVIDSDSTDDTIAVAEAAGARVVRHSAVLEKYGSYRGKGEALWKSLFETTGDLIAWSDTDIQDWHPRFLYGTLGPLLTERRIGYVKAYYQRPIVEGGLLKEGGGGRVTELVARPLINLFYPELSGYIQPLAGEYAGRREHLEQIPFFTGYAVEMGHLIDLAERFGLNGFGQVDLDIRIHRNQELEGLSKMSFTILQAVMKRLEERRRARLFADLGSTMKLPRSSPSRLSLEVIEIADAERPPMIRIPEYAARRESRVAELSVLVAPDSFKGSLTSVEVAHAIATGWGRARPLDSIALAPLADGGEGLLDAVAAAGGWEWLPAHAEDALGRVVEGRFLKNGSRAVVELATASGLSRLTADGADERDAMVASTFGTGQILATAIALGANDVVLGLGGSATNDGGSGLLRALGVRFLDASGDELLPGGGALGKLASMDLSALSPTLRDVTLTIASDVTNPLTGDLGAAATYGPQKGATSAQVQELDANLAHYAAVLKAATGRDVANEPGSGAAGGTTAGLLAIDDAFASLRIRPGVDVVMELTDFDARLTGVDLVITGEGRIDEQTAFGKTALGVARRASAAGKSCICFGGGVVGTGADALATLGAVAFPVIEEPMTVAEAMAAGTGPLERAAERVARVFTIAR